MPHRPRTPRRGWRGDDGQITGYVVVLVIGILTLTGLTLDGGLALAAKVRAAGQAEAAARAGAQAIDLTTYRTTGALRITPTQATADAQAFLAAEGATGTVTATEDTVTVTVTTTQPTQLLGLIGIQSFSLHAQGSAGPQHE